MPSPDPVSPDLDRLLTQVEWLQRLARRVVVDPGRADDAAQDAWVAALRHPPGRGRAVRPWLARVLRNAVRSRHREDSARLERERAVARAEADCAPSPSTLSEDLRHVSPDDLALHGQRRLVDAVLALDEGQRHVIVERYWHGHTPTEIAARDGLPLATVKSRLRRALVHLRAHFGESKDGARGRLALLAFARAGDSHVAHLVSPSLIGTWIMGKKIAAAFLLFIALGFGLRHVLTPMDMDDASPVVTQHAVQVLEVPDDTRAPQASHVRLAAAAQEPTAAWPIDREHDLHGVVVDLDGAPVQGAAVRALHAPRQQPMLTWDPHAPPGRAAGDAATDTSGRFRIPLAKGRLYDVIVEASGYGDALQTRRLAGERVDFVLDSGQCISGRVLIEGEGVAGVSVLIGPSMLSSSIAAFELQSSTSGENGHFRFDGLAAGGYRVSVECTAFVAPPPMLVDVIDRDVEHDLKLSRGRVVHGRVIDDFSGEPLSGVAIEAGRTGALTRTRTNENGEYRLDAVVGIRSYSEGGNRLGVVALAAGYVPVERRLEFMPAATDPEVVDFRLLRGATVQGTIILAGADAQLAEPRVRGATIDRSGARATWQLRLEGNVAPSGEFEVRGVRTGLRPIWSGAARRMKITAPQTALLFTAEGCGSKVLVLPPISDEAPVLDVGDIILHAEATISGRVVDENGNPVPHARVVVAHSTCGPESSNPDSRGVNPWIAGGLASRTLETDDIGRFHVGGLPPGVTTVRARLVGIQKTEAELVLAAGDRLTGVELVLPAGKSISGRIVTADGRGVPNALLQITTSRGGFGARADHDGSFKVSGLDDRPCAVVAFEQESEHTSEPLLSQEQLGVAAGTDDLEIILPFAVMARGTVLRSDGTPALLATVRMKDPGYWRELSGYTDEEGAFAFLVPKDRPLDVFVRPSYPDIDKGEVASKTALVTSYDPASGPLVLHLKRK